MAFLKVGKKDQSKQRLYIMQITMPLDEDFTGLTVIKIGKTSGVSAKARMLDICSDIYDKFRRTPMIHIARDRQVPSDKVFEYEATLHNFFQNYKYNFKSKWSGHTECFVIPLEDAKMAFEAVIDGQVPDYLYELPEASEEGTVPF